MRSLVRPIVGAALLFWLVLTLTFLLVHAAPGDPAALLVPPTATGADVARLRSELGLDASLPVQYARWAHAVLRGDLGESFTLHQPVTRALAQALPYSASLGAVSLLLTFVVGIALGTVQAARRGTRLDTVLTVATTAAYAAPSFWLALALIAVFTYGAVRLGLPAGFRLPAFGVRDPASQATGLADLGDLARHAVLPVVTLTVVGAAGIARYSRTIVADLLGAAWVRAARAKGLATRTVYAKHVLANALAPFAVLWALALPGVLAGSVFVESVFAWPGMGRLMLTAIASRDYPVVMGAAALYGGVVILANLAADLALPILEPRMRG